MEIDIVAESNCGRVVFLIEVRKKKVKTSPKDMADFLEKVEAYQLLFSNKWVGS
jgi:Holliday junction resolvase-like predicted endonuclease